ncbi:MAG: SDR family oxidoreductase, partial [Thermodesulfobacteriota bacterium]
VLETNPEQLRYYQVDITRREELEAALADLKQAWGAPHGLVNNAALDSPPDAPPEENGPFETYPESSWDRIMAVNAKGVFLTCQVVGGAMAEAGRGSIVNVASIYGVLSPDQRLYEYRRRRGETFYKPVAYTASKSSLLGLTRYLATYWAPRGVRVNALVLAGVFNHQDPEFLKAYCAKVPLGRMARADEYNGAVVFLLSDASSYMTGSELVLDGGFTSW